MGRFKHSIRAAVAGVAAGATLLTLGAPAALCCRLRA